VRALAFDACRVLLLAAMVAGVVIIEWRRRR
jgi:hypothetical protein